tara:strand:- start:658 stop:1320 length:663 start_codon:yes stop_codon:yes gene_type:complete
MKLCFKYLVVFFVFLSTPSYSKKFEENYLIELGNLDVGKLNWKIDVSETDYKIELRLKGRGFLTGIYNFEGFYEASGLLETNNYIPLKYKHVWKTKKKERVVELFFEKNRIKKINQTPTEKEMPRINLMEIEGFLDPLSSFLKILNGSKKVKTIDGRRTYTMAVSDEETKRIMIKKYKNIWADHNRKDFKYIEISNTDKNFMPSSLKIKFKGLVFNLTKI